MIEKPALHDAKGQYYGKGGIDQDLDDHFRLIKRDLVLRLSHELNTPLSTLYSASMLLSNNLAPKISAKEREWVDIIHRSAERLKSLIENLLDSIRLDVDMFTIHKEQASMNKCILDIIPLCEYFAKIRKQTIILDLAPALNLKMDSVRMEQVLSNIIMNAINNTLPGGTIRVSAGQHIDRIWITVTDTGVGLTQEEISKLFLEFGKIERYGRDMDIVTEGLGIGLYVTKKIIDLHLGKISVQSEGRYKGCSFIIQLPVN